MQDLAVLDSIALRAGQLSFDGWLIKPVSVDEMLKTGRALAATDFEPDLKQKHVDMKIGLDIAWLASKKDCRAYRANHRRQRFCSSHEVCSS
jgi:hypothetical protein